MDRQEASDLVTSLFESWYSALVRYAYGVTGSAAAAQDAVQQSFMALYRALVQGQQITYPKAWTLCVLRREIAASWEESADTEPLSAVDGYTRAHVEPELCGEDIPKLLSYLTPREQEVLMLRMEAYKYREIAESLGISPNSVNTLLSRAIAKLQKLIKPPKSSGGSQCWAPRTTLGDPTPAISGEYESLSNKLKAKRNVAKTLQ
jgi:RNA polymerase sigma-70 factor (ECF subfamily)